MIDKMYSAPIKVNPSGLGTVGPRPQVGPAPASAGTSFRQVLQQKQAEMDGIKFSAHAAKRIESRGLEFKPEDFERLKEAVTRAESKGSKESLIMLDDLALIVSVRNRTVITAMERDDMKENVVTNIDSAVIV
jgi:flagellar operon protein